MTVDEYIAQFPEPVRERLGVVRALVRRCAPAATEAMAYGMPAYKLGGKPLVYFAGYEKHIGLYALPVTHEAFRRELAGYKQGKGSVQFPLDQPLPLELIEAMVRSRLAAETRGD